MYLDKKVIEEIFKHALETYPEECCGILTGNKDEQTVHFCQNIQNRLHMENPGRYPRDAQTAYAIDRKEAEGIYSKAKDCGEEVIAFYHSHADHDAYFSDMDKEVQTVFGEPEFPDTAHVVISVKGKEIKGLKFFRWDKDEKDFIAFKE